MTKGPLLFTVFVVAATASAPTRVSAHTGPHGAVVVAAAPFDNYDPFWSAGRYGYQYPGYVVAYDSAASLRLQVEPRQAEVYVDGYYAGTVNDFDGFFQRLHVASGQHEIELYLDGYRVVKQQVYLQPGSTFKIHYTMEKLQAGDTAEERPTPQAPPASAAPPQEPPPLPSSPPTRQRSGPRPESAPQPENEFGSLVIQVQPGDAEILIDGEPWQSSAGTRLVVQLPPGDHRIEVRKNGFETFRSTVRIRRGETTPVNVSLARE